MPKKLLDIAFLNFKHEIHDVVPMAWFQPEEVGGLMSSSKFSFKFPLLDEIELGIQNFQNCLFEGVKKLLFVLIANAFKCQKRVESVDLKDELDEIWNFAIATFNRVPKLFWR